MRESRPRFGRRKGDKADHSPPTEAEWREAERTVRDRIGEVIAQKEDNTQARFARAIGVSPAAVSEVRHKGGRTKHRLNPTLQHLWRIGRVYGVSVDWLLGVRGIEMDAEARTTLAGLRPALRQELLAALQYGPGRAEARDTAINVAVGGENDLWEEVVRHFREKAEQIERRQSELQGKAVRAALHVLATNAPGTAAALLPVEFYPAGDPRGDTVVSGNPEDSLTPGMARSILQAFGESAPPTFTVLRRQAPRRKRGK